MLPLTTSKYEDKLDSPAKPVFEALLSELLGEIWFTGHTILVYELNCRSRVFGFSAARVTAIV